MKLTEIDQELAQAELVYSTNKQAGYNMLLKINQLSRDAKYPKGIANSLKTLSSYYQHIGDYAKMLESTIEAIDIFRELINKASEAHCLNDLGAVYNFINDHETRLEINQQCLKLRNEIGDQNTIVVTINNIGDTYLKLGEYDKAQSSFEGGLQIDNLLKEDESILTHNLGELHYLKGDYQRAISYFEQAAEFAKESDYTKIECEANKFLGKSFSKMGNSNEGYSHLIKACNLAIRNDFIEILCDTYKELSQYYEGIRDNHNAYGCLKLHMELRDRLFEESKVNRINAILSSIKQR
ncbi:MAG: tetratricopeptide repeat protein [Flavobacteriales bacterium]|nr:tetratricopeptide repeat protein [Flavobacteriales bacterium]